MYKILSISDSDKHFIEPIKEYLKRLGKKLEIVDIAPSKSTNKNSIIISDTENIKKKLEKYSDYHKVLLSIGGKALDTVEFANVCQKNTNVVFVIGGAFGLDEDDLAGVFDLKISLGKITMPHGLAKLVLLEQIYRSDMINNNKNYHY